MQHGFCVGIADTTVEFSWTPEISIGVPIPKHGLSSEQLVGGCSFEQMECLLDAHRWWELHNSVNVVRHDTQFDHLDAMSFRYFVEDVLAKLFILLAPKHIVSVLGAPLNVVEILAFAMATANEFHNI